ncbi:MAG: hypothetical protein LUC88_06070 [Prevotella sp.]|nr:hypothetical protein [Prevotella sp.]
MKKTINILRAELLASIIVAVSVVIIYETETLLPGDLSENKNVEFLLTSIMELLTICLIPLSLRLFKFAKIHQILVATREKGLRKLGSMRMLSLCLPMVVNTILYYQFMNVTFGYMAIIGLICLPFIYPSKGRCISETREKE